MSKRQQMKMEREAACREATWTRALSIGDAAEEWEELEGAGCEVEYAARVMQVSEEDAAYFLRMARQRMQQRDTASRESRRKPSLSEALLIWGTSGIMRVRSRVKHERSFPIPQSMA